MEHIEIRHISDDYLRNEACDICGRPKAVTKRCLVHFDCGYEGELNICTWDLRTVDYKGRKIEAPRRDHFHVVQEKTKTWFNLDEVFAWIRQTMNYPQFEGLDGGKEWRFKVEPREGQIVRHAVDP